MDKKNRKTSVCAFIERVNDHKLTFRLKISDGRVLELNKAEIGNFIPQKGMAVQTKLFNSLILQEVALDGIYVLRRTPQKLLELLAALTKDLQLAAGEQGKIEELEASADYQLLPPVFRHRLKLLREVMKKDFTAEFLQKQMVICQIAYLLSKQNLPFITHFDRSVGNRYKDFAKAINLNDGEITDAKNLAMDYQIDKGIRFNSSRDFERSTVLLYKGLSSPYALRVEDAIQRYVAFWLAG